MDGLAGWVLIAAPVLAVAAMLHHPSGGGGTPAESAASVARIADMGRLVHGALIVLLLAMFYGVAAFARVRGFDRPLVLAGFVFFSAGIFAMLPPPVIDGFVLPDLAQRAHADADALGTYPALMRFGFLLAVTFAKVASALISLGIVLFSVGLMHERGAPRWFGLVGVLTVAPVPIALLLGLLDLNVHGMLLVVIAWSFWFLGIGVLMVRGRA